MPSRQRNGGGARLHSFCRLGASLFAALLPGLMPLTANAKPVVATNFDHTAFIVKPEIAREAGGEIYTFYAERGYRPLWLDDRGAPRPAVNILGQFLATTAYDGFDTALAKQLAQAADLSVAGSSPDSMSRAEIALSNAFISYAQALASLSRPSTNYEHDSLRPQPRRSYHLLQAAADAGSLEQFVSQMRWMHPLYAPLRRNMAGAATDTVRRISASNLARIREIPVLDRQIVVNIASAELWMFEGDKLVDTMRVVVGKPTSRTPLLAGYIRQAIVNPYWNVPPELVRRNIAGNVLRRGIGYLRAGGYQVLSDWTADPPKLDAGKIDWKAVSRGDLDLRVRQLPGPGNAMGRVKFEFPNQHDIYLHDTPDKALMVKELRQFSAGCIRLEDAERLGRWLMRGQPLPEARGPETRVDLPRPVPVYVTYLTANVTGDQIALGPDPYGIDSATPKSLAVGDPEKRGF